MKNNPFAERIKKLLSVKGMGFAIVGLIAGLILLMMPSGDAETEVSVTQDTLTSAEYCLLLEQKAVSLIKQLPDADDCSVFITLEKGFRYVYATDQHVREESDFKETDKTVVLAGNGSGENAILIEESMPKVAGVAVVCKNASYETQYKIIELMCALFDISSNRISVQT